jgi:hypothetical protein
MESNQMKKSAWFAFVLGFVLSVSQVFAEEETVMDPTAMADATTAASVEAAPTTEAAVPDVTEAEAVVEVETADNLEFVSGEVTSIDQATKTVTLKLYGETEGEAEKTLSVKVEDTTDITDGEKDRELASLTAGTEVDVEYDPASSKATYIFIY